jgi:hypothetical protein
MSKLKCSVKHCLYNQNNLCGRNAISIDGYNSYSKSETCCESYSPISTHNFLYEISSLDVKPETTIYCDAVNCVFQKDAKCHADHIEIKEGVDKPGFKAIHTTNCKTFECIDKNDKH